METHPENVDEAQENPSPYPSPPDVETSEDVDLHPQLLEELREQDKAACRRTMILVLVILFVGICMIIAIVTLRFTQSSSSTSSQALTWIPATFDPTTSPSVYVSTDYPTFIPTTLLPTFPPVPPMPTRFPTKMIIPTKKPSLSMMPNIVGSRGPTTVGSRGPTTISTTVGSRGPTMRVTPNPTKTMTTTAEPTTVEYSIVRDVALEGGAEFLRPNSYQSKALRWLEQNSWVSSSGMQMIQRYTLACISIATTNVSHRFANPARTQWKNTTRWMTATDECTWYGVECDSNKQVIALRLNNNGLTGSFPPEVKLMASTLKRLDIGDNNIWNANNQVLFLGDLVNLEALKIGSTYFEYYGIPAVLGNLVKLTHLDISYTMMFGPMRAQQVFGNLRNLVEISMGGNSYNESIPSEISSLPKLANFYCDYADIIGTLDFIVEMPSIFEIWMDDNPRLTGTIPHKIGTKSTILQSISFTGCGLSGSIPTELGSLLFLQQLWLSGNSLTGTIPTTLPVCNTFSVWKFKKMI